MVRYAEHFDWLLRWESTALALLVLLLIIGGLIELVNVHDRKLGRQKSRVEFELHLLDDLLTVVAHSILLERLITRVFPLGINVVTDPLVHFRFLPDSLYQAIDLLHEQHLPFSEALSTELLWGEFSLVLEVLTQDLLKGLHELVFTKELRLKRNALSLEVVHHLVR